MSLHFLSHAWEVRDFGDGITVTFSHRDLDALTVPVLVDDLFELVLESGQVKLCLDFSQVHCMASIVIGKLLALDNRLHQIGGHLILKNVDPSIYELFQASHLADILEVQLAEYQNA